MPAAGDHCYELETADGQKGDGFMDAQQPVLSRVPWGPGFGNHEFFQPVRGNRLLNMTAGMVAGLQQAHTTHHGPAGAASSSSARAPPPTAQWYSLDIGLLHLVQLDLSPWFCAHVPNCQAVDNCGFVDAWSLDSPRGGNFTGYRAALLAFVEADLARVDRQRTPWVIVTAHYPLYETYGPEANAAHEASERDLGARGRPPIRTKDDDKEAAASDEDHWRETTGIKWCSGGGDYLPGDVWKEGLDNDQCPYLPLNYTDEEMVRACEDVCDAAGILCAGFTFYIAPVVSRPECCFRDECGSKPPDRTSNTRCYEKTDMPDKPSQASATADLEPLLLKHKIDLYFAGHNHNYESTWPLINGTLVTKNLTDTPAPVHIVSGAGGPPNFDDFGAAQPWTRSRDAELGYPRQSSYSRVEIEKGVLRFEQVLSSDGTVIDRFELVKTSATV